MAARQVNRLARPCFRAAAVRVAGAGGLWAGRVGAENAREDGSALLPLAAGMDWGEIIDIGFAAAAFPFFFFHFDTPFPFQDCLNHVGLKHKKPPVFMQPVA
jgi:hypothetical protein